MGTEYDLISQDAKRALEEFGQDFAAALAQPGVEPWAKTYGFYRASKALLSTMPIPISAALYAEFKGDIKYRSLFEKALQLRPKTWQDGVAELRSIVEAPDFIGWAGQPEAMAAAASALSNEIIAEALEANDTCQLDDLPFFSASHPINIYKTGDGTFDNDFTGAGTSFNAANLKLAKAAFRALKAPNGKPLGLRMTHCLFPAAMEEDAKDVLEQDMVIQAIGGGSFGAVDNRHKGTVTAIFSDELEDDAKWYPLALNKPGMYPWWVQDQGEPEQIISDVDSALYKSTLKIGIAYVLRGNGTLALPHCIQRWAGQA